MEKRSLPFRLAMIAILLAAPSVSFAAEITVSAAMSLKSAFEEVGRHFEETHPGTRILFNFGPSGGLARQVEGGAPVDVFASASQKYMNDLETGNLLLEGTRQDFARNSVVLVVPDPAANPVGSFAGLAEPSVERIAIANPATAPAGRYAMEVFRYYGITEAVSPRLVLGENVRQVMAYVTQGEVDAAVLYRTDVLAVNEGVRLIATAPSDAHAPVSYPVAVIRATEHPDSARRFLDYLLSRDGRAILGRYGFMEPGSRSGAS